MNPPPPTITTSVPMAIFSIREDDEEPSHPPPPSNKRQRCSEPPTQRSFRQNCSARAATECLADEEEELITVDDEESDTEWSEEEEDDSDDDGFILFGDDRGEQNQQQQIASSSRADSLRLGLEKDAVGLRNSRSATPVFNNASSSMQVVLTDPDVLDCPICLDPLSTPVFQCENGHIACSTCCSKIKRKCPSCCMPIGYNRCRAIEKVIESLRVSCKNSRYGCKESIPYSKKYDHEEVCPHATCCCPYSSCPFAGSSKNLYLHFGIQHSASTTRFTYNTTFTIQVQTHQKHIFLQEEDESVIFILNHEVQEHGRAFNVDCVGPSSLRGVFLYRLEAKSLENLVLLQSVPEIFTKWSEHEPRKNHLTVPTGFLDGGGILSLDVCIKKGGSSL